MKASKNVLQHAESSIVISDVSDSDSGIYKCVAKTELDNAEADAELVVQDVPQVCLFCFYKEIILKCKKVKSLGF